MENKQGLSAAAVARRREGILVNFIIVGLLRSI